MNKSVTHNNCTLKPVMVVIWKHRTLISCERHFIGHWTVCYC